MSKNNEINIIELMQTLWLGRWKIIVILLITVVSVYIYESKHKNDKNFFTATTPIMPVSTSEIQKYMLINNQKDQSVKKDAEWFNITKEKLLKLFLEVLNEKTLFEEGIRKNNLLDPSQYENEIKYDQAIIQIASSIKIEEVKIKNEKKNLNYTIKFSHHDPEVWKNILEDVNGIANLAVKNSLKNQFKLILEENKQKDIFKLEDISIKIDNAYKDYESSVSKRVFFLKEQSAIAKELGIAKNTIEVQTFGNQTLFSNVKTDTPFYLRGYEAIDKEIELISLRNDKKPFIDGLLELEQQKRSINQDKSLERIEAILELTPLADNNDFYAATIKGKSTQFDYYSFKKSFLALSIVVGLIIGTLYVIFSNAISSREFNKKN
tara:strand:+ start:1096 stop:2232 length:1137 start_codon:yes stop_codon:yes gene_type:complete